MRQADSSLSRHPRPQTEIEKLVRSDTHESQENSIGTIEAEINFTKQKIEESTRGLADLETIIADSKLDEKKRALKLEMGTKESEREALNAEFATLNQHSETRATLNVKRESLESKEDLIRTQCALSVSIGEARCVPLTDRDSLSSSSSLAQQSEAHRKLVGTDPVAAQMENAVTRALT